MPVTPFAAVRSLSELESGLAALDTPAILKTAAFGYDGKGQARVDAPSAAQSAWETIGKQEAVLEAVVDFACELSVVAAQYQRQLRTLGSNREHPSQSHPQTVAGAGIGGSACCRRGYRPGARCARAAGRGGGFCVEMFLDKHGRLLVNELAPRPRLGSPDG